MTIVRAKVCPVVNSLRMVRTPKSLEHKSRSQRKKIAKLECVQVIETHQTPHHLALGRALFEELDHGRSYLDITISDELNSAGNPKLSMIR